MSKRTIIITVVAIVLIAAGIFSLWSEKQKEINDLLNVSDDIKTDDSGGSGTGAYNNDFVTEDLTDTNKILVKESLATS